MEYFDTNIESRKELGSTFSFSDFCDHMRTYRNNDWVKAINAVEGEIIAWIREKAPDTTMITESVVKTRTCFDDSVVFKNIHPDIDGLTRQEVLVRNMPLVAQYGQAMIDQLNVGKEQNVVRRWCVMLPDEAASEFKLALPNIANAEIVSG